MTTPADSPSPTPPVLGRLTLGVVIATYDRPDSLRELLGDLAEQVTERPFRVVVVDDGGHADLDSVRPVAPPFDLRFIRRDNGGPGAARHCGIEALDTDVIVIVDDDMRVATDFVQSHWDAHQRGAEVVYGFIAPPDDLDRAPLFARFHQRAIDQWLELYRAGTTPSGGRLCTGNVSMRRGAYVAVGGFDLTLVRCEDRDLGLRLEERGCRFAMVEAARSEHRSDHRDAGAWRRRNVVYGRSDEVIARKHPRRADVSPWSFLDELPYVVRPLLVSAALAPRLLGPVGAAAYRVAELADRRAAVGPAMKLVGLTYGLDYYRGVGLQGGGARAAWRSLRAHRRLRGVTVRPRLDVSNVASSAPLRQTATDVAS